MPATPAASDIDVKYVTTAAAGCAAAGCAAAAIAQWVLDKKLLGQLLHNLQVKHVRMCI